MVYIQSKNNNTVAHHFDCSCALYGAEDSAMDYRLVSFEEVQSGKMDALIRHNLFVGSVEFMREVFSRVGLKDVRMPLNSDRKHEIITLGEAKEIAKSGKKIFIKPFEIKLFTGFVLDQMQYSCLNDVPDDTKVMAYEPFRDRLLSEWRIYVHRGKIVDSRNYSGDFKLSPDNYYAHLENKLKDFKGLLWSLPIAYTVDIGILDALERRNEFPTVKYVIVEFNDMWAIGNYGMPNDLYLDLLRDRYFEIMKR